jgi:hypothetical protein
MKDLVLPTAIAILSLVLAPIAVARPQPAADELINQRLIDDLATLDCPVPGISETGTFGGFLAESDSTKTLSTMLVEQQGRLRLPVPCSHASIRNVMRNGLAALPALIRHLDDKRPTRLVVGRDLRRDPSVIGGQLFTQEYDPRHHGSPQSLCDRGIFCGKQRSFVKPYAVKIGDVCFVLVGQIVNRQLNAVRYQPTGLLLVNSPVETPALAKRVRADWSGIGEQGVKNALLADLSATPGRPRPGGGRAAAELTFVQTGALRRLRFYFPGAYAALSGADAEKRAAFEKAEHEGDK